MAKFDLNAEAQAVGPVTRKPDPIEPEPDPPKPKKPAAKKPAKAETNDRVDDKDAARLFAEAAEQAEAERVAAAERHGVNGGDAPNLSKADRQKLRRLSLRLVAVELTIDQGAKLDRLTEFYGSQRAAIGALIDAADLPDGTDI